MKQIKHIILLCLLCLTGIAAQAQTGPADNEIWYTATSAVTPTNILGTNGAVLTVNGNDYDESAGCWKITFNGAVITIGENAFQNCSALSSITIPASVTSIGKSAFQNCYDSFTKIGLTTVTFAEDSKLETIGDKAFYYCICLSSITIPASVTSIGKSAFKNCYDNRNGTGLTTVTFAEGSKLEAIGDEVFNGCSLLSSITIPASVTSIGKKAFYQCYDSSKKIGLTTVTFAEGSKLETIGESAFNGCKVLSTITIPASVTSIGKSAFYQCYDSSKETGLTEVTFADGSKLETIGESAFNGCKVLSSITIPASVTSIGKSAFQNCSGIESVTLNWTEASEIVTITNAALILQTGSTLLVPAGTEDLYAANESWSGFKDYMKPYITANQDPNNKEDYYATFYSSSKAYKLSKDVTAYTGAVDGSVLKLKPIADGIIPAGEGVVLKLTSTDDTEAKVNFLVEESMEAGTKDTENVLKGKDEKYIAGQYDYALTSGNCGVGFYPLWGKTIGAHKAYFTHSESSPAKSIIFQFEDEPTGIKETTPKSSLEGKDFMYDLNGVSVNNNYKDIVIKNRKKFYHK